MGMFLLLTYLVSVAAAASFSRSFIVITPAGCLLVALLLAMPVTLIFHIMKENSFAGVGMANIFAAIGLHPALATKGNYVLSADVAESALSLGPDERWWLVIENSRQVSVLSQQYALHYLKSFHPIAYWADPLSCVLLVFGILMILFSKKLAEFVG